MEGAYGIFVKFSLIFICGCWVISGLFLVAFATHCVIDIGNALVAYEVVLVIVGVLTAFVGGLGLYGILGSKREIMKVFITLVSILTLVAWSVDFAIIAGKEEVIGFKRALKRYNDTEYTEWRTFLDSVHVALKCCGRDGPADFDPLPWSEFRCGVPPHVGTRNGTRNETSLGVKSCHEGGKCSGKLFTDGCRKDLIAKYVIAISVLIPVSVLMYFCIYLAWVYMKHMEKDPVKDPEYNTL